MHVDKTTLYCVVGAGSSGITAAKNLKQLNIPFEALEREDDIGGNWYFGKPNSSVYKSTHLISSKPLTEYSDYPMPSHYPDYPSHVQVLAYLRDYARHFGVYPHIQFNTSVNSITPNGAHWDVAITTAGGHSETRTYRGVIIANGHNWDPKYPTYKGTFSGETMHSGDYKTPDVLRGKRVLVVGAGNSGCDIAVEAAANAAKTFHSTRRAYHYVPKFAFGRPADQVGEEALRAGVPLWLRRIINEAILGFLVGDLRHYGLRRPDHQLFETHPIINSQILYAMRHGDLTPKCDIAEYRGDEVVFVDGSIEQIDMIIYATGFKISFPFIDKAHLNWRETHPHLYLNVFHPKHDNLFVAGLIQPDSGQFGLVDWQSKVIARFIHAQTHNPAQAEAFRRLKAEDRPHLSGGAQYIESTRHYLEIEHYSYRERFKKLVQQFAAR
jgi:cation diffusion facilitator CzcD-associated flavoprotein CzcO